MLKMKYKKKEYYKILYCPVCEQLYLSIDTCMCKPKKKNKKREVQLDLIQNGFKNPLENIFI